MKLRLPRTALSLGLLTSLALAPSVASAAKWTKVSSPAALLDATHVARYLDANRDTLGLVGVELTPRAPKSAKSRLGNTYRFEQRHEGLRVWASGIAVRVDRNDKVTTVVSEVAAGLTVSPVPAIDEASAIALIREFHGKDFEKATRELVVVGDDEGGRLGWLIEFPDFEGGMSYIVDANTGDLLRAQPLALDVNGRVYAVSSVVTPTPSDVELLDLDIAAPQNLNGWGGLLKVSNYVSGNSQQGNYVLEQTIVPNVGPDFLFDPPVSPLDATDAFAQVNLYHHLTDMRRFFATLDVDMTSPAWKLTAVANGLEGAMPMDNAFYSPQLMTNAGFEAPNYIVIGQGSMNDFAYDSDVFKHEFGHYVSQIAVGSNLGNFNINSYGLSPHSGSIDEGVADYFACSDNDDPTLGEASLGLLGAARELDVTNKKCPDDMVGEVHADGEIIASLGWTLRTTYGAAIGDKLVWGGLSLLPPGGTFGDFGRGVTATAAELVTAGDLTAQQATDIQTAMAARGVDICDEEIPLEGTETRKLSMIGVGLLAQFFGGTCSQLLDMGVALPGLFHFFRTTDAADTALVWKFAFEEGGGDAELAVYVRKNTHVTFKPGLGGFLPEVDKFDAQFTVTEASPEVVIDASSMPGFDPGSKYYIAVVNRSCPTVIAAVSASNEAPNPTTSSTGGSGGTGSGGNGGSGDDGEPQVIGGCGCSIPETNGTTGGLALATLLALGLVTRRRDRRA